MPQSNINSRPTEEVLQTLQALCADEHNSVYIISGRRKSELGAWFASVVRAPLTPPTGNMRPCRGQFMHLELALSPLMVAEMS